MLIVFKVLTTLSQHSANTESNIPNILQYYIHLRKCTEILYVIEFYINSKGNFAIIKISQCMFSDEKWKKSSNMHLLKLGILRETH